MKYSIVSLIIVIAVFVSTANPVQGFAFTQDAPGLDENKKPSAIVAHIEPLRQPKLSELQIYTPPAPQPAPAPQNVSGTCSEWIAAAGITDTYYAQLLINGESGCNPHAVNSSSGACGIPQELPCGKSGCGADPVCQLKWMQSYVFGRYGSWSNAYSTWLNRSPHWY